MGMVLGLSLTPDDVAWVLVDEAGSVVDHDTAEFCSDAEIANAAARGAHAIATAGGYDVDRVRLVWSDEAKHDGMQLQTRLGRLGFREVEAVPLRSAVAVMVQPDMEPDLALAYGAARAEVDPRDAITVPVATQRPESRGSTRGRIAMAVLGAAAAAAVGAVVLASGTVSASDETAATPPVQPSTPDPGWVAVPALPDGAAGVVRKVAKAPAADVAEANPVRRSYPVQPRWVPERAAVAAAVPTGVPHLAAGVPHLAGHPAGPVVAPLAVPEEIPAAAPPVEEIPAAAPPVDEIPAAAPPVEEIPAAAPPVEEVPAGQPHLPDAQPAAGPASVEPALPPAPEMTDPANLFSALP